MTTSPVSRRSLLLASAATVLLAGCAPEAPTAPSASPTPSASGSPGSPSPAGPATWEELGTAIAGVLLMPDTAGYDTARLVQNPRFDDAHPQGILQAASAADVAAGLAFARTSGVPVALRSGGHGYAGWSAGGASGTGVAPSLVISTATLTAIEVAADGTTVRMGPGAPLARVYETLASQGRAIASGSCGTVAIGGITLGGGVGVLSRSFGLTCDQLIEVEIVTADGVVHTVSASGSGSGSGASDADLFWACRGGGGGAVGVVTNLTFATRVAPPVTMFSLGFAWADAAAVVAAWQTWAPSAADELWSTLKLLGGGRHPSAPSVSVSGTWIGAEGDLAGLLTQLTDAAGVTPVSQSAVRREFGDAMLRYAGCAGATAAECTTGPGGLLTREPLSATSSIALRELDTDEISVLIGQVEQASPIAGLVEGGISLDALGGAVARVAASDTAFPYRDALMTVQYTAVFEDGADPAPYDDYVRAFRAAMTPAWGDHAYVNYADPSLQNPGRAYFADNLTRLSGIRSSVDPTGMFAQPHFL